MAEKILNTRIQLKYDTWDKWNSEAGKAVVLKKGEIGICEIPVKTGEVAAEPAIIFKVGDGTTIFSSLPWASAKAADVYDWAKQSEGAFVDSFLSLKASDGKTTLESKLDAVFATNEELKEVSDIVAGGVGVMSVVGAVDGAITIGGTAAAPTVGVKLNATQGNVTLTTTNGLKASIDADNLKVGSAETADKVANALTLQVAGTEKAVFDGSKATTVNITAADLGLSGAMHFLGITLTDITDGGQQAPNINGEVKELKDIALGSVVLSNNKEFVLTGTQTAKVWELLGDEGSYALKGISITGDEEHGLTGGGTLTEDRKISIKDGGVTGAKIANNAIAKDHLSTELADWIRNQVTTETASLAAIAKTGNVLDLVQGTEDVLVFNCGSATLLVENTATGYRITIINPDSLREQYSATVTELGTWAQLIAENVEFISLKHGTITLQQDDQGKVKLSDGRYLCVADQTRFPAADKYVMAVDNVQADYQYEIEIQGS